MAANNSPSTSQCSYSGSANAAANNTIISLIRGGFSTHAMNTGQHYLQLNFTYVVKRAGLIVYHVAQAPPNPNLFQPGPALLFVTVNDIPINGRMVIVGNSHVGAQPTTPASTLPPSSRAEDKIAAIRGMPQPRQLKTGEIAGIVIGSVVGLGTISLSILFFCIYGRRIRNTIDSKHGI